MERQMTMAEMESEFASEWILVEDPQTNDAPEPVQGKVVHHSTDRDEVYRQAVALRPKRCAILYTGRIPADAAFVLFPVRGQKSEGRRNVLAPSQPGT